MSAPSPLGYFALVLQLRRSLLATLILLGTLTAWIAWVDPINVDEAIVIALFAQMFAAATGYRERALRGHFDPILAFGWSRVSVAVAHWMLSVAPGVLAWLMVSAGVAAVQPTRWPASLTASGLVALLYVSCAAWAFALPLTRYISGVIWVAALVVLAGVGYVRALRDTFLATDTTVLDVLARAGSALVCPVFLLSDPQVASALILLLVAMTGALLATGGALFIARLDVPLRDLS